MSTSTDTRAITWWSVARRPRWILALLLALGVAAGFAALGQWQIGRAVETAAPVGPIDTETARPLGDVDQAQTGVTGNEAGLVVEDSGVFATDDWTVLTDRFRIGKADGSGDEKGAWVVGHLVDQDGDSVAVAIGWAADVDAARASIARLADVADATIVGRYLPGDAPQLSDFENGARSALAPPELLNLWTDAGPIYNGYVVLSADSLDAVAGDSGLRDIVAPAPVQEGTLNLLNVFYAIEWVVFAGFALYIWYRLVRDEQEKEVEAAGGPAEPHAAP